MGPMQLNKIEKIYNRRFVRLNPLIYEIVNPDDQPVLSSISGRIQYIIVAAVLKISLHSNEGGCLCFADLYDTPSLFRQRISLNNDVVLQETEKGFMLGNYFLFGNRYSKRTVLMRYLIRYKNEVSYSELAATLEAATGQAVSDVRTQIYDPLRRIHQKALERCGVALLVFKNGFVSLRPEVRTL